MFTHIFRCLAAQPAMATAVCLHFGNEYAAGRCVGGMGSHTRTHSHTHVRACSVMDGKYKQQSGDMSA